MLILLSENKEAVPLTSTPIYMDIYHKYSPSLLSTYEELVLENLWWQDFLFFIFLWYIEIYIFNLSNTYSIFCTQEPFLWNVLNREECFVALLCEREGFYFSWTFCLKAKTVLDHKIGAIQEVTQLPGKVRTNAAVRSSCVSTNYYNLGMSLKESAPACLQWKWKFVQERCLGG